MKDPISDRSDRSVNAADRELEEALAYARRLKAERAGQTEHTPPAAPPEDPSKSAAERFRPADSIVLAEDGTLRPAGGSPPAPVPPPAEKDGAEPAAEADRIRADANAAEENAPRAPRWRRILGRILPVKGDPWWEIGRKLLLLAALAVLIGSGAKLLNEAVIIPRQNENLHNELADILVQSRNGELTDEEAAYDGYPEGINPSLKKLYYLNHDIRGWLTYPGCDIDEWVMYSGDQSYYLTHDFYRNSNKNGSLFFDAANNLSSASSHYKSLVIYGHNMASGQMFAKLNNLASSVDTMRAAGSIIQLETLFDTSQYKIFAVVIQDSQSKPEHYFSIQATSFASNTEFLSYVEGLRARSLYNFSAVDVTASDDILILYTCSPKSVAGFEEGRLAVVARKVRSGESASVSASSITVNKDVIMPYAWYTAQKKTPHAFYANGILPGGTSTDAGSTTATGSAGSSTGSNTASAGSTAAPSGSTPPASSTASAAPSSPSTPVNVPSDPTVGEPSAAPSGSEPATVPDEPTVPTEPNESTEPAPEDPTEPEPSSEPEPSTEPEPSAEPAPSGEPEPSTEPEPSSEPEPSTEPEPSGEPEPAA